LHNCIIPIGFAERTNYLGGDNFADPTRSGHEIAAKKTLAQAGMTIKDVKSFHPYDDFIIAIMIQFEAFGFCKPGEGVQFVREHDFAYNGDLPLNTGGGQISAGQAACSSHNLVEAVRQLMREGGERQIKNTENALVTGIGWINYGRNWGTSAALMLGPNG
jgi:acetyl-CoA acetyltransferase